MRYIHEQRDWPRFRWAEERLLRPLAAVRHKQGRLVGHMQGLGFSSTTEAMLQTLTQDVIKSSEIEGEVLDRQQVRSSIARRLGIDIGALTPADRNVDGVVEMMLDATQKFAEPLTKERLFGLACSIVPYWPQRHAPNPCGKMAQRRRWADASRFRSHRSRARSLRSAGSQESRSPDGHLPQVVRQ